VRTKPGEGGQNGAFVSNLEIDTLKVHRLVYTPVASRSRVSDSAGPFSIKQYAVLQKEPHTEEEVAEMTLDEVNAEIQRCLDGAYSGGLGSQGHKSFFNRLVWMEKIREKLHRIPAPLRNSN
jgi:hypothetical protein